MGYRMGAAHRRSPKSGNAARGAGDARPDAGPDDKTTGDKPLNRLFATLCLGVTLSLPVAARADEAADRVAVATTLVNKTLIKNLQTGFNVALEKTVAPMPEARAEAVRKELLDEFDKQRGLMVEGLSKDYAEKFSLAELKHLDEIYSDPTYLKFQTMNADPNSSVTAISQNSVTKLLNMLAVASASDNTPKTGAPPMPPGMPPAAAPAPAPK